MNVVEDAREAIATQNQASFPKETSAVNDGPFVPARNGQESVMLTDISDTQLQMLQLLSAHTKLLLDAPEHLWRLIERKNFFPAAWLFLLARVVYRALVTDDEQDDGTWRSQGLDVLVGLDSYLLDILFITLSYRNSSLLCNANGMRCRRFVHK
jgi:hypothetical protein